MSAKAAVTVSADRRGKMRREKEDMTIQEMSRKLDAALKKMSNLRWKGAKIYRIPKKSKARR